MPKEFKYDVIQFIRCVKERPCLWDKSLESHKDRMERSAAWGEVFNILEPRYEDMSPMEKKTTGDIIINKWTNIRDAFIKSLKPRYGKPKRKYMLYNQLKFLLKVVPETVDAGEYHEDVDNSSTDCNDVPLITMKFEADPEKEDRPVNYNTRKRLRDALDEVKRIPKKHVKEYDKTDVVEFDDVEEVDVASDARIMNEDEAFFASLLPSVVRYSEDERLEFRIEVLALMRRIKEKRDWKNTADVTII